MGKKSFLIIGSGIIGLSIARAVKSIQPDSSITILDKEEKEAFHASSRNSGVLHAGFYYATDSLKAKFTVEGNNALKIYCRENNLALNECGKLVVAQNDDELKRLYELEQRGKRNGSNVEIIDESRACEIEPNIRTYKQALYSPDTASIDPKEVCQTIKNQLNNSGVKYCFNTKYVEYQNDTVITNNGEFRADKIINCAGLYADKIAQDFGFGQKYTMIPFKGLYLKYTKNKTDVGVNIYPVPNLKNPFLGVHFTKTVTDEIKIGPTAIPALWRENYKLASNFSFSELIDIAYNESKLFLKNSFGFRNLAFEEMRKYSKNYFIKLARNMVQNIDSAGFTEYTEPGIRAQLLDKEKSLLVQDFVVEGNGKSTHILNAVSPAFTCAFPFAQYVVSNYILKN